MARKQKTVQTEAIVHDFAMDRYQKIEKNGNMGEGTYGVVYKAKDRLTDKFVAMKVFLRTSLLV